MMTSIKAAVVAAIFSGVAVLLHSWQRPYGLFLALAVIVVMMRYIASSARNRLPTLIAAGIWFLIAWIGSNERNGSEILIVGDAIGSAFVVGGSALVVLLVITSKRS